MPYGCSDGIQNGKYSPEIIRDMIADLSSAVEKTIGKATDEQYSMVTLEEEVQRLKCELACCQQTNLELESEILGLRAEVQNDVYKVCEQNQRRKTLERNVKELKQQVAEYQEEIRALIEEKQELSSYAECLEEQLNKTCTELSNICNQRDELLCGCQEYESCTENVKNVVEYHQIKCTDMQDALKKCCRRLDSLQEENCCLKEHIHCFMSQVEQLLEEKKEILLKNDEEKSKMTSENEKLKAEVTDLKQALSCLEKSKTEACKKLTEVIKAHHSEMNKLREEASKWSALYENEKYQRQHVKGNCNEPYSSQISIDAKFQNKEKTNNSTTTRSNKHTETGGLYRDLPGVEKSIKTVGYAVLEEEMQGIQNLLGSKISELDRANANLKIAIEAQSDLAAQVQTSKLKNAELRRNMNCLKERNCDLETKLHHTESKLEKQSSGLLQVYERFLSQQASEINLTTSKEENCRDEMTIWKSKF